MFLSPKETSVGSAKSGSGEGTRFIRNGLSKATMRIFTIKINPAIHRTMIGAIGTWRGTNNV